MIQISESLFLKDSNTLEGPISKQFSMPFRAYAGRIQRPFGVRYNPYTQSVEVLSNATKIAALVSELRGDLCIVSNALRKIHEQDDTVDVEGLASMLRLQEPGAGEEDEEHPQK